MMKQKKLNGKVFLVTGGTQGIGEEIAKTIVANGAGGIIICGRHVERGQRVTSELQNSNCESLFVKARLENADECSALVETCDKKFGRLDGLVNAAELTERGTIFDTTPENWLELAEAGQPFGRLISTQDVANAVLFLVSADSGVMTGSIIDFDQTITGAYD